MKCIFKLKNKLIKHFDFIKNDLEYIDKMNVLYLDEIDEKLMQNIKRSCIIKDMKKNDIYEYKITKEDNIFYVYRKKENLFSNLKLIYKFKTYNKNKCNNNNKRVYINDDILERQIKKIKID